MDITKRVFSANDILEQPSLLDLIQSPYVLISDSSMNQTFHKLLDVMTMLRTGGQWRLVNVTSTADYTLVAVYERMN